MADQRDGEAAEPPTWVTAGVVLHTSMEEWPRVREAIRLSGAKLVYQRLVPASVHLYITERVREEGP